MALLARALLVGVLLALFVRTYLLQLYRVPTDSMVPGLLPGDHVAVDLFLYGGRAAGPLLPQRAPRRFDLVVFRRPDGSRLVKRVLGLPGERLEVRSHLLWADGVRVDQPEAGYLALPSPADPASPKVPADFGPLRLGRDEFLLLGDHRGASLDSRVFGPVARRDLIGRAFLIYFSVALDSPAEAATKAAAEDPSFAKIPGPARYPWVAARWNRCFRPLR